MKRRSFFKLIPKSFFISLLPLSFSNEKMDGCNWTPKGKIVEESNIVSCDFKMNRPPLKGKLSLVGVEPDFEQLDKAFNDSINYFK